MVCRKSFSLPSTHVRSLHPWRPRPWLRQPGRLVFSFDHLTSALFCLGQVCISQTYISYNHASLVGTCFLSLRVPTLQASKVARAHPTKSSMIFQSVGLFWNGDGWKRLLVMN